MSLQEIIKIFIERVPTEESSEHVLVNADEVSAIMKFETSLRRTAFNLFEQQQFYIHNPVLTDLSSEQFRLDFDFKKEKSERRFELLSKKLVV